MCNRQAWGKAQFSFAPSLIQYHCSYMYYEVMIHMKFYLSCGPLSSCNKRKIEIQEMLALTIYCIHLVTWKSLWEIRAALKRKPFVLHCHGTPAECLPLVAGYCEAELTINPMNFHLQRTWTTSASSSIKEITSVLKQRTKIFLISCSQWIRTAL